MATTKIWSIKGRVDVLLNYAVDSSKTDKSITENNNISGLHHVVDYAIDDYKTERTLFVTGVNTTPVTAKEKMMQTKIQFNKTDGITAFHAIQSFKPGEVTPELAHSIGLKLAEEMWGDRFEVVVATHLNKHHVHNHFVINSVSFIDGKKYYDNKSNYKLIRSISDRLCHEHGLSVITNPKNRGKHYAEWKAEKEGLPTIRSQIRDEIDNMIKCSYTFKDFINTLHKRGYEMKIGENIKYPSVKPKYSKRFVRLKSLGDNYTIDMIKERIVASRNGIIELPKPVKEDNEWLKKYEPKKLKGFIALYYHYLYLLGKIRKKETPGRVSAYMREEVIKFERYKKQFRFLHDNSIETLSDLEDYSKGKKDRMTKLTATRTLLYKDKADNFDEIQEINKELKACRVDLRICDSIKTDSEHILNRMNHATLLDKHTKQEKIKSYPNLRKKPEL